MAGCLETTWWIWGSRRGTPTSCALHSTTTRVPRSATSGALLEVDLVITVDTMLSHPAAALGRPVWTLLAFAPDLRWMLGRNDTP